jgi:hypothetical protein
MAMVQKIRPASRGTSTQKTITPGKTPSAARRRTSTHGASGAGELGSPRTTVVGAEEARPATSGRDAFMATGSATRISRAFPRG